MPTLTPRLALALPRANPNPNPNRRHYCSELNPDTTFEVHNMNVATEENRGKFKETLASGSLDRKGSVDPNPNPNPNPNSLDRKGSVDTLVGRVDETEASP